jgi:transposase-like protein
MSHPFPDERRERAAIMAAEGIHTDEEIARAAGVTRRTVQRWRQDASFMARVGAICDTFSTNLVARGIVERQARLDAYQRAFDKLEQVIAERAADPSMQEIPGGKTGLVVRRYKSIGAGESASIVEEYEVDTPTLKEIRATLQQTAQDAGQWSEKQSDGSDRKIRVTLKIDQRDARGD